MPTRAVLPRNDRPSFFGTLRIQFSTLAVSHVLPGGSAAGAGLGYRLLTESGVSSTNAGFVYYHGSGDVLSIASHRAQEAPRRDTLLGARGVGQDGLGGGQADGHLTPPACADPAPR